MITSQRFRKLGDPLRRRLFVFVVLKGTVYHIPCSKPKPKYEAIIQNKRFFLRPDLKPEIVIDEDSAC